MFICLQLPHYSKPNKRCRAIDEFNATIQLSNLWNRKFFFVVGQDCDLLNLESLLLGKKKFYLEFIVYFLNHLITKSEEDKSDLLKTKWWAQDLNL